MTKREFLENSDIDILGYDISETLGDDGSKSIDAVIETRATFQIVLTKNELQHLINEIEAEEKYIAKHGHPSYIED